MAQTTYSLTPDVASAGMLEAGQSCEFDTCIASEDLSPGLVVEYDPNDSTGKSVRLPQSTSSTLPLAGVIMYRAEAEPGVASPGNLGGPLKKGQPVQVLRKGRIWCVKGGTAMPTVNAAPNVMHSSTIATNRGKVTGDATATTAGSEITATTGGVTTKSRSDSTLGLVVVQFNLPA